MRFAEPVAWAVAVLIPIAALLNLLRPKRPLYHVPSLLLWGERSDRLPRNAASGRFRFRWRLLLQAAALACAAAALARPYLPSSGPASDRLVLVVDISASMADGDRFARAKRAALARIAGAPPSGQTALIAAGPAPALELRFTQDKAEARRALERLQPLDGGSDLEAALRLAESVSRGSDAQIALFTDRAADAEQTARSVVLTRLDAFWTEGGAYEAHASLRNWTGETASGSVHLTQDGAPVDAKAASARPGQAFRAAFRGSAPEDRGAVLSARLDGGGAAYAVLPARSPLRILMVGGENRFRDAAFALNEPVEIARVSPSRYLPGGAYDLTVFDGWAPESLPRGSALIIHPPGDLPFARRVGEVLQPPAPMWDRSARLTRFVDWGGFALRSAGRFELEPPARALVWSGEAPLAALWERSDRRAVLLAFDAFNLRESSFALTPGAAVFAANVAEWAREASRRVPLRADAGEPLGLPRSSTAHDTAMEAENLESGERTALSRPARIHRAGAYRIWSGGEPLGAVAVNVPAAELEPPAELEPHLAALAADSFSPAPSSGRRELWRWFALLAGAAVAAEWVLYERGRVSLRAERA